MFIRLVSSTGDINFVCKPLPLTLGVVVVVIVCWLDLQLPMQSVPIITNVVSSNPAHGKV